jgi:hypothetical protein
VTPAEWSETPRVTWDQGLMPPPSTTSHVGGEVRVIGDERNILVPGLGAAAIPSSVTTAPSTAFRTRPIAVGGAAPLAAQLVLFENLEPPPDASLCVRLGPRNNPARNRGANADGGWNHSPEYRGDLPQPRRGGRAPRQRHRRAEPVRHLRRTASPYWTRIVAGSTASRIGALITTVLVAAGLTVMIGNLAH